MFKEVTEVESRGGKETYTLCRQMRESEMKTCEENKNFTFKRLRRRLRPDYKRKHRKNYLAFARCGG